MELRKRVVTAVKILAEVRERIERDGGKYNGLSAPNIQSAIDVLTIPEKILIRQSVPKEFEATREEVLRLQREWER